MKIIRKEWLAALAFMQPIHTLVAQEGPRFPNTILDETQHYLTPVHAVMIADGDENASLYFFCGLKRDVTAPKGLSPAPDADKAVFVTDGDRYKTTVTFVAGKAALLVEDATQPGRASYQLRNKAAKCAIWSDGTLNNCAPTKPFIPPFNANALGNLLSGACLTATASIITSTPINPDIYDDGTYAAMSARNEALKAQSALGGTIAANVRSQGRLQSPNPPK